MEKRKIEIIEEGGIKEGLVVREEGDIYLANKDIADAYIKAGLAKCAETGEVGERKAGSVRLEINSLINTVKQV